MDYQNHYALLVESRLALGEVRLEQKKVGAYFEKHHIISRCCGGTDSKDNLVWLTAREHFMAHRLLCMISTAVIYKPHELRVMLRWFNEVCNGIV